MITGIYRGLNYEIEQSDRGSYFCVYEYTPILKNRHDAMSGSSCESGKYTLDYVKKVIDEAYETVLSLSNS